MQEQQDGRVLPLRQGLAVEDAACEADDCVLLFLPAHPRRRWCSAARCGNRVRVARHYRRHRPAEPGPESS
ncbi:CGNR zinc finger domain-containing protein [Actinomadura sp. NPDC048032]|uniref:CGNR zinc finger domain-containing protein n=1 Tax=Actinomadura sp. NPDC048032 TaxID=3155747 RepID=UPI00340AEF51